jgi:hypothetical protein
MWEVSHLVVLRTMALYFDLFSPIKSVTPLYSGKVVLKMGLFPRIPAPEFETFALHRHEWQGLHRNVELYKIKAFGEKL